MDLLQKEFIKKTCVGMHTENHMFLLIPWSMVERMVRSTFSSWNVYRVVDDNSNPYRNTVMDAMRINQGHAGQCPIVDGELNVDAARFFYLLKGSDEPLWDGCINHGKLLVIAHVFTIKSDC